MAAASTKGLQESRGWVIGCVTFDASLESFTVLARRSHHPQTRKTRRTDAPDLGSTGLSSKTKTAERGSKEIAEGASNFKRRTQVPALQ